MLPSSCCFYDCFFSFPFFFFFCPLPFFLTLYKISDTQTKIIFVVVVVVVFGWGSGRPLFGQQNNYLEFKILHFWSCLKIKDGGRLMHV